MAFCDTRDLCLYLQLSLMLSPRTAGIIIRPLRYFKLIFVVYERSSCSFILLLVEIQFSHHQVLMWLSFSSECYWHIRQLGGYGCVWWFLSPLFSSIIYTSVFGALQWWFCYYVFVVKLEIKYRNSSNMVLSARDCLSYLLFFSLPYTCWDWFF